MSKREAGDQLSNPLVDFQGRPGKGRKRWGSTLKPPGRLRVVWKSTRTLAGDQLSNPLVDFTPVEQGDQEGWGSTLKPPGRLPPHGVYRLTSLGINSQTPW